MYLNQCEANEPVTEDVDKRAHVWLLAVFQIWQCLLIGLGDVSQYVCRLYQDINLVNISAETKDSLKLKGKVLHSGKYVYLFSCPARSKV